MVVVSLPGREEGRHMDYHRATDSSCWLGRCLFWRTHLSVNGGQNYLEGRGGRRLTRLLLRALVLAVFPRDSLALWINLRL